MKAGRCSAEGLPHPRGQSLHSAWPPPTAPLTKAAHRRLPGGHLLLVEDEQLFQVIRRARFLELILGVPDQVVLGLWTRPSR